jgi:hypothetical protein
MVHAVSIKEGAENMLHENAEELKVLTLFPFVFVLTIHQGTGGPAAASPVGARRCQRVDRGNLS